MRKLFTLLLAVAASIGTIFAESGTCGENLTWDLTDGVLTINGTGGMYNYNYDNPTAGYKYSPWHSLKKDISAIVISNSVTSIGDDAFYYCTRLTSVTIGNSVTSIGRTAFSGCSGLTSVTIGNSVTSIGNGAFSSCSSLPVENNLRYADTYLVEAVDKTLASYTIKDGTKLIGSSAFYRCTALTSITIPNSVTSIGNNAFNGCSGLTSIVWNAKNCNGYNFGSQVTSFVFGNEVEVIPDGICSGMTNLISMIIPNNVTSIGDQAFSNCSGLTSLIIGNNVTNIGGSAFAGCSGLTSVIMGNNVASIGDNAFNGCSGLTSILIPNNVTSIGSLAFSGCTGLSSVTIPNSVTSIGSGAFVECSGLTSVVWNAKNCNDFSYNTTFPAQITSFIFGDEVEYIPAYLCNGMSQLNSISIPNSVTSIGDYAFSGCSGLTSVTIPNSVTSIGSSAFYRCTALTSIIIPNSVTSIGDNAFSNCSSLSSLTIGNSVTSIGANAFYRCTALTSIEIPNSVTSIGNYAFERCTGLTSIVIPNSVQNCKWRVSLHNEKLINVEAPSWFFDVEESSWAVCPKYLKSVIINDGEINDNGFGVISRSYKTLTNLDIAKATNTNIADEAFKGFYNLQSLALPANLTKVSYMSVAECVKLQSIDIPASIIEIEDRAFENCRSLKSITFGGQAANLPGVRNSLASTSQLQSIGNWAFYNCHELQNLEIPEGVTFIGDGAFYGCVYLEDLTLPSSVQTIGDNTFALCAKLQKIVVNAPVPPSIQAKTFYDVKRQIPVYVPDESVEAYKNDAQWSEFDIQGVSKQPTAIDQVESSSLQTGTKGRLILRNGQVLILNGNKTFTLTGQEVQ